MLLIVKNFEIQREHSITTGYNWQCDMHMNEIRNGKKKNRLSRIIKRSRMNSRKKREQEHEERETDQGEGKRERGEEEKMKGKNKKR